MATIVSVVLGLATCSRQTTGSSGRMAVLRFENLTPDAALDWMGRAASEIIAREINTDVIQSPAIRANQLAQGRPVAAPGISTERDAAILLGAKRLITGQISRVRDRLVFDVTVREAASGRILQTFTVASHPTDVYGLADAAARQLVPHVTPFDTRNNDAVAAWAKATEENDYARASDDYAQAVKADPDFATAWLGWAGTATGRGDRSGAERVLSAAQQHANRFSELSRARLKLASSQLTGDRTAILAALNEVGRLLPNDPDVVTGVAEQNYSARQFQTAAEDYRRLTAIQPNNGLAWNQLGYTLMYSGNYDGAMSALATYQRLAPKDPNPLDSQGDVAFAFGRFADAEKLYEQAAARNPQFENSTDLWKAAMARLMTGDIAEADKKVEAFKAARTEAQDAALPLRLAQWRFLSGRHEEAISSLEKLASSQTVPPQLKSIALTQMAIWDLQLGRRDRALRESNDAMKTGAATPVTLVVRFASEDARTAQEWSARADRLFATPQIAQFKPLALAYAFYLAGQWDAAAPIWKDIHDRSRPEEPFNPVIYAHVLTSLNRPKEAAPLVRLFPLPQSNGSLEFQSLAVPEIFDVRAAVLKSEGKTSEAEVSRKLFEKLWPLKQ